MSLTAAAAQRPLRVAVDVRCLAAEELRGFSRYTDELLHALRLRPSIELLGVSDRPLSRDVGFPVELLPVGREWAVEQIGFARLARTLDAEVIFCPTNRGLPAVGLPSVLTLHDAVEWDPALVDAPTARSRVRFAYASTASLAGATRIITVSRHAARDIVDRLRIDRRRLHVVTEAPGRRFTEPATIASLETARRRYGLPERFVLYVGGFDPKKSVETLIRAWNLVPSDQRPMLILGGSRSSDSERLLDLAHQLGLAGSVRMIGYVDDDDLPALYSAAELFVFPAVAEGFGLPPIEAMSCGTPTIVADAGALPEVVGTAALRFPARDHVALADIATRLLQDPGERVRLGNVSSVHARSRDWHDVAVDTEEVLRLAAATSVSQRVAASVASLRSVGRWLR